MNKKKIDNVKVNNEVNNPNIKTKIDIKVYEKFADHILKTDLTKSNIDDLIQLYDMSQSIINEYYLISENSEIDNDVIMKLQYAAMTILYNLNIKNNEKLTNKVNQQESLSNSIKKDAAIIKSENKNIKKELKTIVVTIIAIVLAISIIPTAVAGVENMPPNYILPFISSVILLGMIMIVFVFSIYSIQVSKQTWIVFSIMIVIFISVWLMCWNIDISFTPKIQENTVQIYK